MHSLRAVCLTGEHFIACTRAITWYRLGSVHFCLPQLRNRLIQPWSSLGWVVSDRRDFSKKSSPPDLSRDLEDDHPENTEILQTLRAQHHYHHGAEKADKKGHRVYVLEPDFKWGKRRFKAVTSEHRMDEACGLIRSIENWQVVGKKVESVRKLDGKTFFGKGKIEELSERFEETRDLETGLDSVFIDVDRLNSRQHKELEDLWDMKVFDRFGVVLQIFKERAKTAEAKIQVELAELPYIR